MSRQSDVAALQASKNTQRQLELKAQRLAKARTEVERLIAHYHSLLVLSDEYKGVVANLNNLLDKYL